DAGGDPARPARPSCLSGGRRGASRGRGSAGTRMSSRRSPPRARALEVEELDAFYGKSQVGFAFSLVVNAGETVAVLGRNGAGKTSMLMAIAGAISNRSQRLVLDGRDISRLPPFKRVRAGLALVPSGSRAFPNLTVEENLSLGFRSRDN